MFPFLNIHSDQHIYLTLQIVATASRRNSSSAQTSVNDAARRATTGAWTTCEGLHAIYSSSQGDDARHPLTASRMYLYSICSVNLPTAFIACFQSRRSIYYLLWRADNITSMSFLSDVPTCRNETSNNDIRCPDLSPYKFLNQHSPSPGSDLRT